MIVILLLVSVLIPLHLPSILSVWNKDARRHVNRLCMATNLPLIESGTEGYLGQVQVIKRVSASCALATLYFSFTYPQIPVKLSSFLTSLSGYCSPYFLHSIPCLLLSLPSTIPTFLTSLLILFSSHFTHSPLITSCSRLFCKYFFLIYNKNIHPLFSSHSLPSTYFSSRLSWSLFFLLTGSSRARQSAMSVNRKPRQRPMHTAPSAPLPPSRYILLYGPRRNSGVCMMDVTCMCLLMRMYYGTMDTCIAIVIFLEVIYALSSFGQHILWWTRCRSEQRRGRGCGGWRLPRFYHVCACVSACMRVCMCLHVPTCVYFCCVCLFAMYMSLIGARPPYFLLMYNSL